MQSVCQGILSTVDDLLTGETHHDGGDIDDGFQDELEEAHKSLVLWLISNN